MRHAISATLALFSALLAFAAAPGALSQSPPSKMQARPELALEYNYLRGNAPPGGCTCFSLNGGSASLSWPISSKGLAIVGDISASHGASISSAGYDLTLVTYTAGARYRFNFRRSPLQPFGQLLVGGAHAGGSLVDNPNLSVTNAGSAFAAIAGGGLDLHVNRRISLRLLDADYLVTTFNNGVNDHQNNLRIGAGAILRF